MRKALKISLLIAMAIFFSCEEPLLIICASCTENEPVTGEINIKLSSQFNYPVIINVYEGNLEDNLLYKSFTVTNNLGGDIDTSVSVVLNKRYTLTATYNHANTYIAVDSAFPRVRYEEVQCDNPCYFIYDDLVNLEIKYTR